MQLPRKLHLLVEGRHGLLLPLFVACRLCTHAPVGGEADDVVLGNGVAAAAPLISVAHDLLVVHPAPGLLGAAGLALERDSGRLSGRIHVAAAHPLAWSLHD